jgi:hypothetical protein
VVWDGENAHVVLFGVEDGEIELPDSAKTHLGEDSK